MSHAAMGKAGGRATQQSRSERLAADVSDLVVASAAAQAALAMPAVQEMSPGLAAQAATYGPERRRVLGVVVRRAPLADEAEEVAGERTGDLIAIEIHVVLSAAHCDSAWAARVSAMGRHAGEPAPPAVLQSIADHIREATRAAVWVVAPTAPIQVDVFIDDVR